jgi:hypothetical protein
MLNDSPPVANVLIVAMRRSVVLAGCAIAVAVVFAGGAATAPGTPVLRSVAAADGHLVVTFTLPRDLVPGRVLVATSRAGLSHLTSSPSVKLREAMHTTPDPATGVARWRTRKSLPAGTYYVEVSGVVAVGVTDCTPRRSDCLTRWSNPLRVVIP